MQGKRTPTRSPISNANAKAAIEALIEATFNSEGGCTTESVFDANREQVGLMRAIRYNFADMAKRAWLSEQLPTLRTLVAEHWANQPNLIKRLEAIKNWHGETLISFGAGTGCFSSDPLEAALGAYQRQALRSLYNLIGNIIGFLNQSELID